jgi:hypothetical protein
MTALEVYEHVSLSQRLDPVTDLAAYLFGWPVCAPPRLCPIGTPPDARVWLSPKRRVA